MFSGYRKIPSQGPTVPVENEACGVSHLMVDPRVGIFLELLNNNDGFFLTYHLATCCIIFVDDVTELIQSRLETAIEEHFKLSSNASIGFTRTTLSAAVSKYVEENQFLFF